MGATRADITMGDAEFTRLVRDLLDKDYGPGRWSVTTMASSRSQDLSAPPPPCELKIVANTSSSSYQILQLSEPNGRRATPRSVNANGIVVGEGSFQWRGPSYPCLWRNMTHIKLLPHGGGFGGSANDINDSGVIVGSSELPDRALHSCTWTLDGFSSDIGESIARHSHANALNATGSIVGWVSMHPTEGGQNHFRPVFWPSSGSPVVIEDLGGGWGEAVDINSKGVILLRVHQEGGVMVSSETGAWLWDGVTVIRIGKPGNDFTSFYPYRVTDDGRVVGLTIKKDGQRGGAIRNIDGTWHPLFKPLQDREVTAANRELMIAGYDLVDYYRVPWVKPEDDEIIYLPCYKFHHHRINMLSEQGWAVGTASADNCCHPLLWIPE